MPDYTMTARWIFPVVGLPLERGTVTIHGGRILAVEDHGVRRPDLDLGNTAILPGLVNAHTHLDLSGLRGQVPPSADFTGWLRAVIRHRRGLAHADLTMDISAGIAESIAHGTTLLGDISGGGLSWALLSQSPLRAVIFYELLGLTPERARQAWSDAVAWLDAHPATEGCRAGLSPHAPYSVRSSLFLAASTSGVPAAVHLAETAAEQELLVRHGGPFVPFLKELGVWAPDGLAQDVASVLSLCNGLSPVLFIHGNYLPPDARIPANGNIVYCPRTHAAFGHAPHPVRAFQAAGVRVALGTDSLASNPDLDVLAEARFVHQKEPAIPGATVLHMATLAGAEALGWQNETGSLEPGKSADLVVLTLPASETQDPHHLVLRSDLPVQAVMIEGEWVYPNSGLKHI